MLIVVTGPPGTGKSTVADHAATAVGGPAIGWDWVMAGLRGFEGVQAEIEGAGREVHRWVGWSVMLSIATAELRAGRSVVLDGVARHEQIAAARSLATGHNVRSLVVLTSCSDRAVHRTRIEGRTRDIPGWYELAWGEVAEFLDAWIPPTDADLRLDAVTDVAQNLRAIDERIRA